MDQHVVKTGTGKQRIVKCRYCNHNLPNTTARWASYLNNCDSAASGILYEPKRQKVSIARGNYMDGKLMAEDSGAGNKYAKGLPD